MPVKRRQAPLFRVQLSKAFLPPFPGSTRSFRFLPQYPSRHGVLWALRQIRRESAFLPPWPRLFPAPGAPYGCAVGAGTTGSAGFAQSRCFRLCSKGALHRAHPHLFLSGAACSSSGTGFVMGHSGTSRDGHSTAGAVVSAVVETEGTQLRGWASPSDGLRCKYLGTPSASFSTGRWDSGIYSGEGLSSTAFSAGDPSIGLCQRG